MISNVKPDPDFDLVDESWKPNLCFTPMLNREKQQETENQQDEKED